MGNPANRREAVNTLLSLLPEQILRQHEMFEPYELKLSLDELGIPISRRIGQAVVHALSPHQDKTTQFTELSAGPISVVLQNPKDYTLLPDTGSQEEQDLLRSKAKMELHFTGSRRDLPDLNRHISELARELEARGIAEQWPYIVGLTHQDVALLAIRFGMRHHPKIAATDRATKYINQAHRAARMMYGKPVGITKISAVWLPTPEFIALGKSLGLNTSSRRRGRLRRASSCPLRPAK